MLMDVKQIRWERKFVSRGYVLRREAWDGAETGRDVEVTAAYSLDCGAYIGTSREAYRLWRLYGINRFERRTPNSNVCSIGYASAKRKWYGWSHRRIFGWRVGSRMYLGIKGGSSGKKITTLAEAKEAAKHFAAGVA